MEKQELLNEIKKLAETNQLTKDEIMLQFPVSNTLEQHSSKFNISEILYFIGAAIVFIGIAILAGQNWEAFNSMTRILIVLGSAIVSYGIAVVMNKQDRSSNVSIAFFTLSALLLPGGLNVLFNETGIDIYNSLTQAMIFLASLAVFMYTYYLFKKPAFHVFNIAYATIAFFALTSYFATNSDFFLDWRFSAYRFLLVGLSYLSLGYYFSEDREHNLSGVLYASGILAVLGSTLALGGWKPDQSVFWELIYPFLVFGVIYLSTFIRSKSFLLFGAIFLMGYIVKITSEYFADSTNWPLALMLCGFVLIGIGYFTFRLKQKYFV